MRIRSVLLAGMMGLASTGGAFAQELPAVEIYRAMLDANKTSGWVAFTETGANQLIHFTPLLTLHCRLSEIRYSINSDALDKTFPVPECIPALPYSLPSDIPVEGIVLTLPSGTAKTLTAQIVWDNGKESEAVTFQPCPGVGDMTCAMMVE